MAMIITAPDIPRLFNVLVLNRPAEPTNLLSPPYTNPSEIWVYRIIKAAVVYLVVVIPVCQHAYKKVKHEHLDQIRSKHLQINRGFRWINEFPFNR